MEPAGSAQAQCPSTSSWPCGESESRPGGAQRGQGPWVLVPSSHPLEVGHSQVRIHGLASCPPQPPRSSVLCPPTPASGAGGWLRPPRVPRILQNCHDEAAKFVHLLMNPGCNYLVQEDFVPFLQVSVAPGGTPCPDARRPGPRPPLPQDPRRSAQCGLRVWVPWAAVLGMQGAGLLTWGSSHTGLGPIPVLPQEPPGAEPSVWVRTADLGLGSLGPGGRDRVSWSPGAPRRCWGPFPCWAGSLGVAARLFSPVEGGALRGLVGSG